MGIRKLLSQRIKKTIEDIIMVDKRMTRDRHNLDIVLARALQDTFDRQSIHFPVDYVNLLRECLEKKVVQVKEIRKNPGVSESRSEGQFSALLNALRNVPSVEFRVAQIAADLADFFRKNSESVENEHWLGDVRDHFEISSSLGTKGRILSTIVRFGHSTECLELGTAYGMSAMFILEACRTRNEHYHLTTIEMQEPQFSLSSQMLKSRYGDHVSCEFGMTQELLPGIVKSLSQVDFVFHDAGHSREDYLRDFQAILPLLRDGAIVLIDDIRWESSRSPRVLSLCYKGWCEIADHPRVCRAAEIAGTMGLLQINSDRQEKLG